MKRAAKMLASIAIVFFFALAIFWLISTSRAATETSEYEVVRKQGAVEIRDYPALTVVSTPMGARGMDQSFGNLFRFITGGNEQSEKIAMTTPVLIDSIRDKRTMSFIMPKKTVEKGVPKPTGEKVTLGTVEAARYAVLRFSGGRNTRNESKAIKKLRVWLDDQKLSVRGDPVFAYYDPPWTPVFMRRNEVMIRLAR